MAKRHPVKPFAEQPAGMRPRGIIMRRHSARFLMIGADMAQIAPLGTVAGERLPLPLRLLIGCVKRRRAAQCRRKAVRVDRAAGEIVGGELPYREPRSKAGGERIGRIVVLMPAFK